jgi:dolichol-phosphate mannosyltransferase
MINNKKIGVVIPSYKVSAHILNVIANIGPEVDKIYVVDDCCPEQVGELVKKNCFDERVTVITHETNEGVGGAVITGYNAAVIDYLDIVVKLDGDGQMDPKLIKGLVSPLTEGRADYTKGNRFFDLEKVREMPRIRVFGNLVLSFLTKFSSGYWNIFDPTNGFTAIHTVLIRHLPLDKLSKRYYFESDILFRLSNVNAVVIDIPMKANYGYEKSNLIIRKIIFEFLMKNIKNSFKRIFYNYYLRDMSLASLELPIGLMMIFFGAAYGGIHWLQSTSTGIVATPGVVMIAALPLFFGLQLLLSFFAYDISRVPTIPVHKFLTRD